ncbi:hypothetical protein UY3_10311 [Chelonia mydas]|uniref:Uncharacterized protein n=1 Tax=Chelonia mydas TaxID=8469 RepID=M7BAF1_CHEMY|nr:hypothetical protein UY3_10311 [Chelonia mydas]
MGASDKLSALVSHSSLEADVPEGNTLQAHADPGEQLVGPPMDVADPMVSASSSSSPDEVIAGPPHPVLQDDAKAHQKLLKRVASNMGLQAEKLEEPSDSLFDVLCSMALARVALPLHEGVSQMTNALWQSPSSMPRISKRAERKYFELAKGHEYLYTPPAPSSLVVAAVNERERQGQLGTTPKNKDSKMMQNLFILQPQFEDLFPVDTRKEF